MYPLRSAVENLRAGRMRVCFQSSAVLVATNACTWVTKGRIEGFLNTCRTCESWAFCEHLKKEAA